MALTKVSGGILDPGISVAGIVTATGFDGPFIGGSSKNIVAGIITATELDISGNIDVDGHTELDQLNVSGVSTFVGNIGGTPTFTGDVTFNGNVSIAQTLTYSDVTNIDSVGIVTARSGIKVLGGGINVVGVVTATQGAVITGVVTATQFKGDGSQLTGIISGITVKEEGSALSTQATTLNFVGSNVTASGSGAEKTITVVAGAGGTFAANAVGVHTTKLVGVNTTTIAGTATSEGAVQVRGNIAITEGLLTLDSNLHTSVSVPTGKNAMLIGPTTVAVGATIDVAQGSTLVVV